MNNHDHHAGHEQIVREAHDHKQVPSASTTAHMYDKHAGHQTSDFLKRFIICTIITIPILALSHMIQEWIGFHLDFPGDRYLLAALSTFVFIYGGYPFLKGLYDEVKHKAIGMMTLIGVAITTAWAYSFAVTFGLSGMDFYWEMATLIDIMLIGHYLEMKSVAGASRSLELLVKMMPSSAHHIMNEHIHDMPVSDLKIGE